jgi:signal transduction histidine kinase
VGAHGGSVTLEEADGSRFVVRLPLRADGIDVDEIVLEEGVRS